MKITKRQLKRIIKEEREKLLKEWRSPEQNQHISELTDLISASGRTALDDRVYWQQVLEAALIKAETR